MMQFNKLLPLSISIIFFITFWLLAQKQTSNIFVGERAEYVFYAPENRENKVIQDWLDVIKNLDATGAKVCCYTKKEDLEFYQQQLPSSDIVWASFEEHLNQLENFLGFFFDKSINQYEDLQRAMRIFMCEKSKSALISSKYVYDISGTPLETSYLFDLRLSDTAHFYSPLVYYDNKIFFYDELILTSDNHLLAKILIATLKSRCSSYKDFLSQRLSPRDIVQWAKTNPKSMFYYPAVKSYCFGTAFWADLFWESKAKIMAIPAPYSLAGKMKPLISSPNFHQLENLFPEHAVLIASWISQVGLCYSSSQPAPEHIKQELKNIYAAIPPAVALSVKNFYPLIYEHYLSIIDSPTH